MSCFLINSIIGSFVRDFWLSNVIIAFLASEFFLELPVFCLKVLFSRFSLCFPKIWKILNRRKIPASLGEIKYHHSIKDYFVLSVGLVLTMTRLYISSNVNVWTFSTWVDLWWKLFIFKYYITECFCLVKISMWFYSLSFKHKAGNRRETKN